MKQRDSFIFYRSFFEAINNLDYENQGKIYHAICSYNFDQNEPEFSGICQTVWILIKPQLDANIKRFHNGNKQKRSKSEANQKQKRSKPEANNNVNNNDNDNGNEKGELSTNIFNFKKSLLELCHDENLVNDFMKVRKTKKATNTETAFNSLKREIENSGRGAAECLRVCIERDWKGFKSDWLNKINENGKSTEQSIADWLNM